MRLEHQNSIEEVDNIISIQLLVFSSCDSLEHLIETDPI